MKNRILTNWTLTRGLYLVIGIVVIVQSILSQQWFGVAFGCYFASMGLFAFGCAAGNCLGGNCTTQTNINPTKNTHEVEYKELKSK